ncbi:MAG: choice-of-anchor J domain-containing protein [Saprospiraceae bacterium]|nr:choice-of-anchor J domain-containing protein [Saprospiraceae bacterium]
MKSFKFNVFLLSALMLSTFFVSGCLKGDFDSPPSNIPEIKADQIMTFDDLLAKIEVGKINNVNEDKYLEGLVVADDKSGNFYKTIILHDMHGEKGIAVSIDENELNALYPVGQVVYVALKDLAVGYYEGLPTLGVNSGSSVGRIPAGLIRSVMIRSGRTAAVTARPKKISELSSNDFNTLIELDGMEFESATANTTFADANPDNPQSVNHNLKNCQNQKLVLRNSGYADFASQKVPLGNGKIVCVYSWFRNAAQLFIRDPSDLSFTGPRCDGTGGGSGDKISIESLRAKYKGADITLSGEYIQGIVISDVENKNINGQNMVVQDGDYGILVRFTSPINVPLGSEVKINLNGGVLSSFNGLLQVQNVNNTNVEPIATGKTVAPKVLTVGQIDLKVHESTLIRIANATLTGGAVYSSKIQLKDATGEVQLYTSSSATFASSSIPSGNVTVTGIVGNFNGKQLSIRNLGDVSGGGPCDVNDPNADCDGDGVLNGQDCAPENPAIYPGAACDDGDPNTVNDQYDENCVCKGGASGGGFKQDFESQTSNEDIVLSGWDNVAVKGNRRWLAKYFSGDSNTYAQATAFGNTAPADMECWLVTPVFDTDQAADFSLRTAMQEWRHDGLTIWVTTNYTGDPTTTSWQQVTGLNLAGQSSENHEWIDSGTVNLKSYGKNLRIGFKYVGTQAANTTSYRIDDVWVR